MTEERISQKDRKLLGEARSTKGSKDIVKEEGLVRQKKEYEKSQMIALWRARINSGDYFLTF